MDIFVVTETEEKRKVIEKLDHVFPRGLVRRDNYEEIFGKIDNYAIFIGAYENDEPVGYAAIYANDMESKIAFITMIGVLENMQGKHVGSTLMKRCVEESQKCGMNAIRLEVLNTNTKAIDFYHHSGFEFEKKCSDDSNHLIKRF